jgi:hypothetical protein
MSTIEDALKVQGCSTIKFVTFFEVLSPAAQSSHTRFFSSTEESCSSSNGGDKCDSTNCVVNFTVRVAGCFSHISHVPAGGDLSIRSINQVALTILIQG